MGPRIVHGLTIHEELVMMAPVSQWDGDPPRTINTPFHRQTEGMPVIEVTGQTDFGGPGCQAQEMDRLLRRPRLESGRWIRDGSDGIHVGSWNCRWGRRFEKAIANPMPIPLLSAEKGWEDHD